MKVHSHTDTRSAARNRFAAAPLYAALLAAAVLSACASSSAWRSSSAMNSDPKGAKVAAASAPQKGTGARGQPGQSTTTRVQSSPDNSATPSAAQSQRVQPETAVSAAQPGDSGRAGRGAQQPEVDTVDSLANWKSGASSPPTDTAALGTSTDATTGAQTSGAAGTQRGGAAGSDAGTADAATHAGDQASDGAGGREALAETTTTRTDAGQADSSLSGAQSEAQGAGRTGATAQDPTGADRGTQTRATAGASEEPTRAAGATAQAADGTSGAATSASKAESGAGGTGLDQATGASAAAAAGATAPSGASDGGSALSQEQGAQQDGHTAKPEEIIIGMVEAPGKKATPTETVIPQTLGGMLPLTLGVEGEGEFDFDKAVLREQVRVVLDQLATKLKSADYDRLEIVGHTDRIGTEVYNQYLSERRAWAVARYLIQQGVPVTKVAVEGRGMHEPVTAANACASLAREEAIACFQQDRRVVISASIRRVDVNVH